MLVNYTGEDSAESSKCTFRMASGIPPPLEITGIVTAPSEHLIGAEQLSGSRYRSPSRCTVQIDALIVSRLANK